MKKCRESRALAAATVLALASLAASPAGAQTQVNSKWITIVLPAEPASLDGCNSSSGTEGRILKQNIVETLTEKDPKDNSLKPRLATSWEHVDPTTWRFKLRQGVTFHDGSPFDAEAVKKSLERNNKKELVCRDKVKYVGDFSIEVTAVDPQTVEIKTSRPEPIMPMRMSGISIVGPNTATDKLSLAPVGTGPYVFDSWQQNNQILLKRNDKYWGAKPQIEGARYIARAESSVRAAMVAVGEADVAMAIARQDASDPKMDHSYLNSETTLFRIDQSMPPLNDKRVRLALNYAFDREAVRENVLSKDFLNATQMVFPSIPGHNHELDKKVRPYDPARAKQLLAEAKKDGVPVDTEITIIGRTAEYPNSADVMEAALTMFRAVGFNMKLKVVETGEFNLYNYKPFPESRGVTIFQSQHDNNFGDPVFSVFFRYACDGGASTLCDPALDKKVASATQAEGQDRVTQWNEIFRYLYEDVVNEVWMYHMVGFARVNPRIDFKPDVTSNAEIHIQDIHFK